MTAVPAWARWPDDPGAPWRIGIEEEVMLVDDARLPAPSGADVLARVRGSLVGHTGVETHAAALELETDPHPTAAAATAQLASLRAALAAELEGTGLAAAVAGTHALAFARETEVSDTRRHAEIHETMRELARREPTYALHVHVAVPDAETANRALGAVREQLPLLLALSANSPFWQARDSGLASARTAIFGAFPRTGLPRRYPTYAAYAGAVDLLLRCGAFADPTFIWWDARLQPRLGTVEVRIMDAQTEVGDVAPLAALVQCLVREGADAGHRLPPDHPEALAESRFLAARDGVAAQLLVPDEGCRVPVTDLLDDVVARLAPVAATLGCEAELHATRALAARPGAERQRDAAGRPPPGEPCARDALAAVVDDCVARFTEPTPSSSAG